MVVCKLGAKTKLVAGMATLTGKPSWTRDLRPVGLNYFEGIMINVDEVLDQQPENSPSTLPTNQQKEKENYTDSTDKNKNPDKVYTHNTRISLSI